MFCLTRRNGLRCGVYVPPPGETPDRPYCEGKRVDEWYTRRDYELERLWNRQMVLPLYERPPRIDYLMCHFEQIYGRCMNQRSDFEFFALHQSWDWEIGQHRFEEAHRHMQAYLRRFHVEVGPPGRILPYVQWQVTFPSGLKLAWEMDEDEDPVVPHHDERLPLTGPRLNCLLLRVRKTLSLLLMGTYPWFEPDCHELEDATLEYDLYHADQVLPGVSWRALNVEHFFKEWTHPHTEASGWPNDPERSRIYDLETCQMYFMREYYNCDCLERH